MNTSGPTHGYTETPGFSPAGGRATARAGRQPTPARDFHTETPSATSPRRSGKSAGGSSSSRPSARLSTRHTYGALRKITRDMLAPLWLETRIPAAEIGERLGVCESRICQHAHALGLGARPKRGIAADVRLRDAEFRRMWLAGVKLADMAEHFGTTRNYAGQKRMHLGLPPRRPRKGAGGFGGFGSITIEEWREQELGRLMAQSNKESDHV